MRPRFRPPVLLAVSVLTVALAACREPAAPAPPAPSADLTPIVGAPLLYLGAFPQIVGGESHSCALRRDYKVFCWGYNYYGQLGRGGTIPGTSSTAPVEVAGGISFKQIAAGWNHSCGLDLDGRAYCWGGPAYGEIGDGSETPRPAPVAVLGGLTFKQITAGLRHTCALTTAGAAYCWGFQEFGQLGNGQMNYMSQHAPVPVSGGYVFKSITAGAEHTCGLLAGTGGVAMCWGHGGTLGNGSSASSAVPVYVGGGFAFANINAGGYHTCGVASAGVGVCWGYNGSGQLGSASSLGGWAYAPVTVGTPYDAFQSIDAGGYHSCGIRKFLEPADTTRNVVCWGAGGYGQLGYGLTSSSPLLRVVASDSAGSVGFRSIGLGRDHSCGINRSGVAYCWGRGDRGQLGMGYVATTNPFPQDVAGGLDFSW